MCDFLNNRGTQGGKLVVRASRLPSFNSKLVLAPFKPPPATIVLLLGSVKAGGGIPEALLPSPCSTVLTSPLPRLRER